MEAFMKLWSKIKGKWTYLNRRVLLYGRASTEKLDQIRNEGPIYREVKSLNELNTLNFKFDREDYKKRFENGHIMVYWEREGSLVSYGWINPHPNSGIGELDLKMEVGENIITLYDFFTFPDFRGQGLYPLLLKKICLRDSKAKLIYVLAENQSSIRGIEKAGFVFLGSICGFNKQSYKKKLKKLWKG